VNEEKTEKLFWGRHKVGLIASVIFFVLWFIALNVYGTFQPSVEASMATAQVNDSIVQYSLIHKLLYDNLAEKLITLVFLIPAMLCSIPAVKDLLKGKKSQ
jgi:hypothetical protein